MFAAAWGGALLQAAQGGAEEQARLPDLDVLYIKRLPAYTPGPWVYPASGPQHRGDPATGRPFTEEELRTTHKQSPAPGDAVEFTAVVGNQSAVACGEFEYVWLLDGRKAGAGKGKGLEPWAQVQLKLPWKWDARHTVGLQIDPRNKVAELCKWNNELADFTDAASLQMRITPELYKAYRTKPTKLGTWSFEDWIQRHVKIMNGVFEGCRYPGLTPDGIAERVRIQEVVVMTKKEMEKLPQASGCDGGWNFYDDNFPNWFNYHIEDDGVTRIDTGLIHELTHQLGIIDMYCIVVGAHWNHVRDEEGEPLFIGYGTRQPGMMGGGGPLVDFEGRLQTAFTFTPKPDGTVVLGAKERFAAYSPETAAALHRQASLRHGHFGLYLFDLPKVSALRILDNTGKPAAGVSVRIFQQTPRPGPQSIPEHPTMAGATSAEGIFPLGGTPFGSINTIGLNGTLLLAIHGRGHTEYRFLDICYFNLAAWSGRADYWLATLKTSVPPEKAPPAPKNLRWALLKSGAKPVLQWDPVAGAASYNVYRERCYGEGAGAPTNLSVTFDTPYEKCATVPEDKTSIEVDPIPGHGNANDYPHFAVTAVDAGGLESAYGRTKELTRWGPYPGGAVTVERTDAQVVKVALGPGPGSIQACRAFVVERGTKLQVKFKTASTKSAGFRLAVAGLGEVQIPLTGTPAEKMPALSEPLPAGGDEWRELSVDLRAALDRLALEKKVTPAQPRTTWNDDWLVTACTFGNWGEDSREPAVYYFQGLRVGK